MIEVDDLTFMQLFWICFGLIMAIFFICFYTDLGWNI
jgi:hypothetical protein